MNTARAFCAVLALAVGFTAGRIHKAASEERLCSLKAALRVVSELRKGVLTERKPLHAILYELQKDDSCGQLLEEAGSATPPKESAAAVIREALEALRGETIETEERILNEAEKKLSAMYDKEAGELAPRAGLTAGLMTMAGAAAAILIL